MDKDKIVLELYSQRKDEGLTALALICGYAELMLKEMFGELTPDQRREVEIIKQEAPKAMAWWSAVDLPITYEPLGKMNMIDLYALTRNEGLTPVFAMKGFSELLIRQGMTNGQNQIIKLINKQCEIIEECWWYPDYELRREKED